MTDVVVTGVGAVTPVGLSAPDTWQALLAGKSGIDTVQSFDASDLPVRIAGEVRGFQPSQVMSHKAVRRSARFSQLAVAAAREAVDDAGVNPNGGAVDPARVGAVVNTAVAGVPELASRPFDQDRDGFVFGEGAVCMVLERADHARARGAAPYARLAGGALTSDAFHVTAPEPTGAEATAALRLTLERSGLAPADVDYISAHGTATKANDRTEARAIRDAFGGAADDVAVSSPKSMVGHLIGAAGALSALTCVFAIRDGIVPPTVNLDNPDPECDLDHVALRARKMHVDAALVNAFG